MGDVIVHVIEIDLETQHFAVLERDGNVRRLHKAESHLDARDAMAEPLDRMALCNRHPRPPVRDEGHQDHGLLHHHVVLDVVQQDRRGTVVSHTPTPGGRATTISSMLSTKRSSGIDISCRRWRTSDDPWRQHSINPTITAPTVIGNQPPWTIFSELEARKVASTAPKTTMMKIASAGGHCQRPMATR